MELRGILHIYKFTGKIYAQILMLIGDSREEGQMNWGKRWRDQN